MSDSRSLPDTGSPGAAHDWTGYDRVADDFTMVSTPHFFARPAADLVRLMDLAPGARLLDVGTGSGVCLAAAASRDAGVRGTGIDPSRQMHRRTSAGPATAVVGRAPGLPFPSAVFDGVCAGFVLSHIDDYRAAIDDMIRVARPGEVLGWGGGGGGDGDGDGMRGGRIGASAWAEGGREDEPLWRAAIGDLVDLEELGREVARALPWHQFFAREGNLARVMRESGLTDVATRGENYPIDISLGDYLRYRGASSMGRLIRARLPDGESDRIWQEVGRRLMRAAGDRLKFIAPAYLVTGTAPRTR